jgi:D-alanyl-D-alanine carboxypeptidase
MKNILLILFIIQLSWPAFGQDNYIESLKATNRIVGLTYAVFTSKQILELGALGKRRVDADSLVKTTDRFHIGSNTKAITAFLAAKLVENKKIRWNTKYFDLFPQLRRTSRKEYLAISLQDLLSHRARINPHRSVNAQMDAFKISGTPVEQRVKFASEILKEPPAKPDSGLVYVYSNAGVSLAASMLEKVSGRSWEQLVDDYLVKQLKLDFEVGFPNVKDPAQPWGHVLDKDAVVGLPPDFDYHIATVMRPAGDLNVSIITYIKFVQLFLRGLKGENNFLRSKTYRYLLTSLPEYSFGWANKSIDGKNYNYHSGSAATFGCFTKIDRDNDVAVIVMENYADGEALNAIHQIGDFLIRKYSSNSKP